MAKNYQKPQCVVLLEGDSQDVVTTSLVPNEVGVDFSDIWGGTNTNGGLGE